MRIPRASSPILIRAEPYGHRRREIGNSVGHGISNRKANALVQIVVGRRAQQTRADMGSGRKDP